MGETWGIGGPTFLALYLGLCGVVAGGGWLYWRRLLGPRRPHPAIEGLTASEIALLNGGSALAIAAAAAKLRRDRLLAPGHGRTLQAQGTVAGDADPLEREVFQAIERHPNISTKALRRDLERAASIVEKRAMLTASGLLLSPRVISRMRWSSIGGVPLAVLGGARLTSAADADIVAAVLALAVCAVITASFYVALRRPSGSRTGRAIVTQLRTRHQDLRTDARTDLPLSVALYGTDALWEGDPAFAAAWGVRYQPVQIDLGGGA